MLAPTPVPPATAAPAPAARLPSPAERLAAWTKLNVERFRDAYTGSFAAGQAKSWPVIVAEIADGPDRANRMILAACLEAQRGHFIDDLAIRVARLEEGDGLRGNEDISDFVAHFDKYNVMQAMVDPQTGLMPAQTFVMLNKVCEASAYVEQDGLVQGTAWLVGPDLVLTAAHVVMDHSVDASGNPVWLSDLKPRLKFCFPRALTDARNGAIAFLPAGRQPEINGISLPYGTPPNRLIRGLDDPLAANNLDFALVRLAGRVDHVRHLDIRKPGEPIEKRRCYVIGFAGGTALMGDGAPVTSIHRASGRMIYEANAIAGMSGGCCVGAEGSIIGIHEGGLAKHLDGQPVLTGDGRAVFENRGICLADVRRVQTLTGKDPLDTRARSNGLGFFDRSLGDTLFDAGLRFAGPDGKALWITALRTLINADPPDGLPMPQFHPWFRRTAIEDWIDAIATQPRKRILFVNGPTGVGKSFTANIIAARINDPLRDLVVLRSTPANDWSWTDAMHALAEFTEVAARTTAGAVVYDQVPLVVAALGRRGDTARAADTPRVVIIDFETADAFCLSASPWRSFIEGLAAAPWARLVLIGLSPDERDAVQSLVEGNPQSADVDLRDADLEAITDKEIIDYFRSLYRARARQAQIVNGDEVQADVRTGTAGKPNLLSSEAAADMLALLRTAIAPLWDTTAGQPPLPPGLVTALAATLAIAFERTLPRPAND